MSKKRYLVWGIWVAVTGLMLIVVVNMVWLALSYDGRCGGFIPEISSPRACSLTQYVFGNFTLLALIAWTEFWPIIVLLLALPVVIGLVLDRRVRRRAV
jgi:hypothetical protein